MFYRVCFLIGLFLILYGCGSGTEESNIQPQSISQSPIIDRQLENCLKRTIEALGGPSAKLTALRCSNEKIEKLNGLFLYDDILELDLSDNDISDITPIYKLLLSQQQKDQSEPPGFKILSIDLANNDLTEADGLFSLPESIEINLNGNPLTILPKAKNVNTFSSDGKNILRWDPLNRVISYKVSVRENDPTNPHVTTFEDIHSSRFEHRSLSNGTLYYYEVTGVYGYGESAPTSVVEGVPRLAEAVALAPPWVKIIDIGGQQLQIDWADVNDADSYTIYFKIADETEWRHIKNVNPVFVHSGLIANANYQYKVHSLNSQGESESSEMVSVTVADSEGGPGEKIELRAVPMDGQIALDWSVKPKAQSQTLYFSTLPYGDITTEADFGEKLTVDNPPWTHVDLDNNQYYYYLLVTLPDSGRPEYTQVRAKPNRRIAELDFADDNLKNCIYATGVEFITELTTLSCVGKQITNLQGIEYLTSLEMINFDHNEIHDVSPLSGLPKLVNILLFNNQLIDITPLAELTQLRFLELRKNNINDITPLSQLNNLEGLGIADNNVVHIGSLSKLSQLKMLDLAQNAIKDAQSLGQLTALEKLDLKSNRIVDISFLADLTQLKYLDVSENQIVNFSVLDLLTGLSFVSTENNQVVAVNFSVGGQIEGLAGEGLVIRLNEQYNLPLDGSGRFVFPVGLPQGGRYQISIDQQPSQLTQQCVVSGGEGTIADQDVDTVSIRCVTQTYQVHVQVKQLLGQGLTLQIDDQQLAVPDNGDYRFANPVLDGQLVQLNVLQQPSEPQQMCQVTPVTWLIDGADVTFQVNCSTETFTVGGSVSGLAGADLILQINESDTLTINENGGFNFATEYNDATDYRVVITQQPQQPAQTCLIANNEGQINAQHVQSIRVSCDDNLYWVGGTVSDLVGSGLVLQNNGTDNLTIAASQPSYIFIRQLKDAEPYDVSILRQPRHPSQTCEVASNTGVVAADHAANVNIACRTDSFTVGGQVDGLVGSGLVLQNAEQTLNIDGDGNFTFAQPLIDASPYDISIAQQPTSPAQTCVLQQGQGNLQGADVLDVLVTCGTDRFAIGGQANHLLGDGLVLQNSHNNETLSVSSAGAFQFDTLLEDGVSYQIAVITQPHDPVQTCRISNAQGIVNSAAINDIVVDCTTEQYNVGGTVVNLTAAGLVLQNNGTDDLNVDEVGEFQFPMSLEDQSQYSVSIIKQPPAHTCGLTNPSGAIQGNDVTSILVNCDPNSYTVGGTAANLIGQGLILQNNGGNDLALTGDGNFSFTQPIAHGEAFNVSILQQPTAPEQTCQLSNHQGTINAASVTNITLQCTTHAFLVGGIVEGLIGRGLTIQNNAQNPLSIDSDGAFTFAAAVEDGQEYNVSVITHPQQPQQTCTITHGKGLIQSQDINSIKISCITEQFTITGQVTGLQGSGLSLQLNQDETITINKNGDFAFQTPLDDQATFDVVLTRAPSDPMQSCTLKGANGMIDGQDITSLQVECVTNSFVVKGQVSGLLGSGLILRNNGEEELPIEAQSLDFVFPSSLLDGTAYNVEILEQPSQPVQHCAVENAVGLIDGADIESVNVLCETQAFNVLLNVNGLLGQDLSVSLGDLGELPIDQAGLHTFPVPLADLSPVPSLSIINLPSKPRQQCNVTQDVAMVDGGDVTIHINCQTESFKLAGVVSGLKGRGLVLQASHGEQLSIEGNGAFQFVTLVDDDQAYEVSIANHPNEPQQICNIANEVGEIDGADTNIQITCDTQLYKVTVIVNGLLGEGLVLQNNKRDNLNLSMDNQGGEFKTQIPDGSDYQVTVFKDPKEPNQTCEAINGKGTINAANVTVTVNCITKQYPVEISLTGLLGSGLVLQNNGQDDLSLVADGNYAFATLLDDDAPYNVTLLSAPTNPTQVCQLTKGSGTVKGGKANIKVDCTTNSYTVSVTVTGLEGKGLVLQNNNTDKLSIDLGSRSGSFNKPITDGENYAVLVFEQPSNPQQSCHVAAGSGVINGSDVNVNVNCTTTPKYPVTVSVSGLAGSGLVLQNNGADDLSMSADGKRSFDTLLDDGQRYQVTVKTQPSNPDQICVVRADSDKINGVEVNVDINCSTDHHIAITEMLPQSPSTLKVGDEVEISFEFATIETDGVQITVTLFPMKISKSVDVTETKGTGKLGFSVPTGPLANVTAVEITMFSSKTKKLLAETRVDVNYQFEEPTNQINSISNIQFYPPWPATLAMNERVTVTFDYQSNVNEDIHIYARPYREGELPTLYSGSDTPTYKTNAGSSELYFTVDEKTTIDQVRFKMWTTSGTDLLEQSVDVSYQFDRHVISNIQFEPLFEPLSPAKLNINEKVTINFDYQTDHAAGVRILVRPFTDGKLTPNQTFSISPFMETGKGKGSRDFTITSGTPIVDQVRFEMWTNGREARLLEQFITVNYEYQTGTVSPETTPVLSQNGLTNITLDPVSGTRLRVGDNIHLTFDYEIADPQGAEVVIRPIANHTFVDNVSGCDITTYPAGSGRGDCDFTVLSGDNGLVMDTIQLQLINAAKDTVLHEQNKSVNYPFQSNNTVRLKRSSRTPTNNKTIHQSLSNNVTVYPAGQASNVPLQSHVLVNYAQSIDTSKVTNETITVQGPAGFIEGTLEFKDDHLLFIPGVALAPATQYQVTLDSLYERTGELALIAPYQWSFVTATQPLSIHSFNKLSTNVLELVNEAIDDRMLYPNDQSMSLTFNIQHIPSSVTSAALSFPMKTLDPFGEGGIISLYHFTAKQISGLPTAGLEATTLIKSFQAPNTSESSHYFLDITEWLNQANARGQQGIGFYLDIVSGSDRYQIPLAEGHDKGDRSSTIHYTVE